ncbi:hypothetical protein MMC17_008581 [Xylographa soralifera]|nr:hypothetical protein [Xylographa soralifera]
MASNLAPIILLVPGGFYEGSYFEPFAQRLNRKGFLTVIASYPSINPSDATSHTSATDAAFVREKFIIPLVENERRDLILFAHSYGGTAGGAAAAGYGKVTRIASGKKGGVIGLIYLAGNIVSEGKSLLEKVGVFGVTLTRLTSSSHIKPSFGLCVVDPLVPTLCADLEPAVASMLAASALPHAIQVFASPSPLPAWAETAFDNRRAYFHTVQDACLPEVLQKAWLEDSGVHWSVKEVDASHSAFLSKGEEVADLVSEFAKLWNS